MHKLLLSFICLFFCIAAQAEALTGKKRELMDVMLEVNKTSTIVQQMKDNLTRTILMSVADDQGEVDRGLATMVEKEVANVLYEDFMLNNKLNDIYYSLYDEYFSEEQLQKIVQFFDSPSGKLFQKHMPVITKRGMTITQEEAQNSVYTVQERITKNLADFRKRMESQEAAEKTQ